MAAAPLNANAGPLRGEGTLADHDRHTGTWQLEANLSGGQFTGTLSVVLGGKALSVTLKPGAAYFENGTCVVRGENGRSRLELRGFA